MQVLGLCKNIFKRPSRTHDEDTETQELKLFMPTFIKWTCKSTRLTSGY